MMKNVEKVLTVLEKNYPTIAMQEAFGEDAFKLLIAVMLSARAKDEVTIPVAEKLFERAGTAEELIETPLSEIEKIIRPIGFFRQKAKHIHEISRMIAKEYGGKVPDSGKELRKLPGVGRKTANVVLAQYFNKPVIAVDTHVHRISNRLGWVETDKPEETEHELYPLVTERWRGKVNRVMVRHGQEICKPRKPNCSECPIEKWCKKVGV